MNGAGNRGQGTGNILRVLIAGGGTGGHVVPALAIARELRDAHDAEVRFVGTPRGLETRLVPEAGFPLELIKVGQLNNVSLATKVRTVFTLPLCMVHSVELLRSFRPQVVIGVGGYASGPAMLAAILLRIPTLVFEPNAAAGMANRLVGKHVSAAAVNFEKTKRFFRSARVTGTPVRPEFFAIEPHPEGPARRLLVFGASQGARILNQTLPKIMSQLLERFPEMTVVHQTGARHAETTLAAYNEAGIGFERLTVTPYLDDMAAQFAAADLILCRSGASSVAEVAAAGRAAVLIPFPYAADDHQVMNAEAFVAAGAAEMIVEAEVTPERVLQVLTELLSDDRRRVEMAARGRRLAHPEAVREIAGMAVDLVGKRH